MPTVIVYWSPGRTDEQKATIVREITDTFVTHGGASREAVLVIFQEIQPGDSGRGGVMLTTPKLNIDSAEKGGTNHPDPNQL